MLFSMLFKTLFLDYIKIRVTISSLIKTHLFVCFIKVSKLTGSVKKTNTTKD